ncbi:MAG: PEGA domain-containing protein [Candidatus Eisenbacteria bacterium]|nr:PEGA domain-containing protein [Candidatus Eisenbacteria bacterium]
MREKTALRRRKTPLRRTMDAARILGWIVLAAVLTFCVARAARGETPAPDPLEVCVDLYWEGRFDEAIDRLGTLTETLTGAERLRAYEFLARSLVRTGAREAAGEAFKTILRADPEWRPDRQMLAEPEWSAFEDVLEEFRNENLGGLNVRTEPSRAQIYFDGETQAGLTPFTLERLPAGEHAIRLEKDGYIPFDTTLVVIAAETSMLEVEMEAAAEGDGAPVPFWKNRWVRVTGGVLGAGLLIALLGGGGGDGDGDGDGAATLPDFPEPPGR